MKHILIYILLAFIITSCVDEIPFENNKLFDKIAISGQFTNVSGQQIVSISEIPNENTLSQANGDPIDNAKVKVVDDQGKEFAFTYAGKGDYLCDDIGVPGRSYKLVVELGDRIYESSSHKLIEAGPIDSLYAIPETESFLTSNGTVSSKKVASFVVNDHLVNNDGPTNVIYRTEVEFEFREVSSRPSPPLKVCYLKAQNDYGRIQIFDPMDYPDNRLVRNTVAQVDHDYRFQYFFSFLLRKYAVDEETLTYWAKIQKIISGDQNLFDPPPGKFDVNIKCISHENENPYGYFTVAGMSQKRIFTNSAQLGYNIVQFCGRFGRLPNECEDCLLLGASSSLIKPDYWIY